MEIHFIDLSLFDDTKAINEMSDIEEWITFLKDEDDEAKQKLISEILERKETIKMAKKMLEEISADEHMREKIASIENFQIDQRTRLHLARQEGIAEGLELGKEKGIYEDKLEVAKAALLEGASIEFVSKITKLDIQTIQKIQEDNLIH